LRQERARAYILDMRSSATRANARDRLVAALQSGVCDQAAALELYTLGPDAVTLALLGAARRITELQARTPGGVSPSTPSGTRPVYTKPNAPGGRRRKRPGARDGHPGHHRPPPNSGFVAVAGGERHSLGLKADGPSLCPGDMNCDGRVTFADIDAFVLALWGPAAYHAQYPACDWLTGDCDGDGHVTFADIDPFVAVIGTTCP
jgi:hypothetical protein